MKKKLWPICVMFSSLVFSQSGVNTVSPTATLDVVATNPTGTSSNIDGVLVPRVDRQRAQSMTGVPVSTIVYINSISSGSQIGTAINIDSIGHYFFNGTVWDKLYTSGGLPPVNTIYNSDGTLIGNRIVTQGGNTLAFTGTAANAFSVDGSTFSIDAANHRVGIGTTSPTQQLDIAGQARIRTISAGRGDTVISPVYVDPNGILVGTSPGTFGTYTSNTSPNIAGSGTGTLMSGLINGGIYKAVVVVGDPCSDSASAEYYIVNNSANNFFGINGISGSVASSPVVKSVTFRQINRSSVATTWTGRVQCDTGGGTTTLDYTLTMPSAGTINVTNNGSTMKSYTISLVRIN